MFDFSKNKFCFVFSTFQMSFVKSDLLIPNPQIFLRLENFFNFFLIFLMIFSETVVPKIRFLTILRF